MNTMQAEERSGGTPNPLQERRRSTNIIPQNKTRFSSLSSLKSNNNIFLILTRILSLPPSLPLINRYNRYILSLSLFLFHADTNFKLRENQNTGS